MTLSEFIRQVATLYENASKTTNNNVKIRRGRSRSISAEAEDLFAELLVMNDQSIEMIRVDQPITIPTDLLPNKKSFQVYPDIVIIKNEHIKALIDLKMDLGWNRDGLIDTCKKHEQTVRLAQGGFGKLKDGQTKAKQEIRFSEDLTYSVVIVSATNINSDKLAHQVSNSNLISERIHTYILLSLIHI